MIPLPDQPPGGLRRLFRLMGGLHPHVVLLGLADLPVDKAQHGAAWRVPEGVGQLGGGLLLVLKAQVYRHRSGVRVHGPLPNLFLGDGGLGLVGPGRRPVCPADGLFQRRVLPFLFGEAQAGLFLTLTHKRPPLHLPRPI